MRTEDGFQVAAGWLDDAGAAIKAVADAVGLLDVRQPVRTAAGALPGSATAAAATSAAASWTTQTVAVAEDLTVHADALIACARAYRRADTALSTGRHSMTGDWS